MACPYFAPTAPALWHGSYPRLPLGEAWEGECTAVAPRFQPTGALLFEICNVGYGRGRCPHFPPDSARDAVRFHREEQSSGAFRILYVYEKECWPQESGTLAFNFETGGLDPEPASPVLAAQATAFARTCLSRARSSGEA